MRPDSRAIVFRTRSYQGIRNGIDKPNIRYTVHFGMPGLTRELLSGSGARGQGSAIRSMHRDFLGVRR